MGISACATNSNAEEGVPLSCTPASVELFQSDTQVEELNRCGDLSHLKSLVDLLACSDHLNCCSHVALTCYIPPMRHGTSRREHITPVLDSLFFSEFGSNVACLFINVFMVSELSTVRIQRLLRTANQHNLDVLRSPQKHRDDHASSIAGLPLWNNCRTVHEIWA